MQQLLYLGGLSDGSPDLSRHLRSRAETANVLAAGSVPLTRLGCDGCRAWQHGRSRSDCCAGEPVAGNDLPALGLNTHAADRNTLSIVAYLPPPLVPTR